MMMKNRKRISVVLVIAMTLSLLLPMGAFAVPPADLLEPEFGSEGHNMHNAKVSFEGDVPLGAAAHFYYYDNGVKYEGKDNEPLAIYEGCDAYISVTPVKGYAFKVFYPSSVSITSYTGNTASMDYYNSRFGPLEGFFQMPDEDLTVTVYYSKVTADVKVFYLGTDETGPYAPQDVPYFSEIILPPAPTGEAGRAFAGWRVGYEIYQPGDKATVLSAPQLDISPLWLPKLEKPEYLDVTYTMYVFNDIPKLALRIFANDKLPAGKRIESLSAKVFEDESGLFYDGEEIESGDVELDGFYINWEWFIGCGKLLIEPVLTADPGNDRVIDLRSGSMDISQMVGGSALVPVFNEKLSNITQFDVKKLRLNRLGASTARLYGAAIDLNQDGYLDIRTSDVVGDIPGTEEFVKRNRILRISGADKCEQATYVCDSGFAEMGKLTIKLFDLFKVKFMDGDKLLSEEEVIQNRTVKAPKTPAKEGYTYKGWKITSGSSSGLKAGDLFDLSKPVTGDLTLTAVWEKDEAAVDTVLSDGKDKAEYTVTKQGDGVNPPEVSYDKPKKEQGKSKTVKVPDTITVGGVTYRVTSINNKAFTWEKKATTIELGANIGSIPAGALKGCKKLKTLKIKNKKKMLKLTKKTFKGLKGKIKLLVPKAFYKGYKKQIKKLKMSKRVKVKKY